MKPKKVLIANRGEIAIRIARSCHKLGLKTVMLYSEADRKAEHLDFADEAIYIGGSPARESYLNISKVIAAAKKTQTLLIHPGYGFLSERPEFAETCVKEKIIFVGPTAKSMQQMGDKIKARLTVDQLKIPRVPGSPGAVADATQATHFASDVGYPVLLKAAAGGGGKGMRRVDHAKDLPQAFESASREALASFGDGSLYVEKLILKPHHIEIQVFGDGKGKAIHLGERECSIQRRHQKVWEETPSPLMDRFPETRKKMQESAIRIAEHVNYSGAGTLEFIADEEGNFYFLEMNTRLQVEHPVTEWVTGVDLVEWQLKLALNELKLSELEFFSKGHSIEVRLYAEDPITFLPAPGLVGKVNLPSGAWVRVDSAFTRPGEVSLFYDPMIAKISVFGPTRLDAIHRLRVALDEVRVEPPLNPGGQTIGSLKTNLSFLQKLVRNERVIQGDTPTDLIATSSDLTAVEDDQSLLKSLPLDAALALTLWKLKMDHQKMYSVDPLFELSNWGRSAQIESIRKPL